jgi:hypothetical protein
LRSIGEVCALNLLLFALSLQRLLLVSNKLDVLFSARDHLPTRVYLPGAAEKSESHSPIALSYAGEEIDVKSSSPIYMMEPVGFRPC